MEKKLKRDGKDKMVAGVASGLANYFELDVTWVRIAFGIAAFFGGSGIWIYLILWIAVPEDKISPFTYTDYRVNPEDGIPKENFGSTFKPKKNENIGKIIGFALIAFGVFFLLKEFDLIPNWLRLTKLFPLVFVFIGLAIIFKAKKKEDTNFKFEEPENKDNNDTSPPTEDDDDTSLNHNK
jgi:phage shock protein PspC (stress-responsive transcriptional regulator)